ncbi:MAG: cyanophycinase, partial [Candidatus Acidiferrum sp.]
MSLSNRVLLSLILLLLPGVLNAQPKWKYFRTGSDAGIMVKPRAGFALMGGGAKQDAAFQFLRDQTNGGDFLILRANTDDDYATKVNKEISAVCPLNSVATIVFNEREDSDDAKVVQIIDQAETIFIAGGDQSNYVRFWQDTPVQEALNRHILAGKPIGGSSAGLAILGEYSFASIIDTIHSPEALANPYGNKVTLSRDFLKIPLLAGTITDTHFVKRDRMGRLLVFMARISQDGWSKRVRAIAVDENAAVLVKPDGSAQVVGEGPAYFLEATAPPSKCSYRQPLTFKNIRVQRIAAGKNFQLTTWKGDGEAYS